MTDYQVSGNLKELIASNINFLIQAYGTSRKEVCADLGISYTTFCDWVNGRTYHRMDALEILGYYFRIDTRDFFIDIEKNENMASRIVAYARTLGVLLPEAARKGPIQTVEEYYNTPEGYPVELINGHFFVCESPNPRHQRIVAELLFEIQSYIKKNKGKCRVYPGPFDVELQVGLPTVVVPDITIVCDPSKINEHGCVGTPDLIMEVLSKSTSGKDRNEKYQVYAKAGVPEYWIINPFNNKVTVFNLPNQQERVFEEEITYTFDEQIPLGIYEDFRICLQELDID